MKHTSLASMRRPYKIVALMLICIGVGLVAWSGYSNVAAATDVGYRDFSYPTGTGENSEPTGEKPESKLWWNDGNWWGSLWSTSGNAYHIHRLNLATQSWIDTGTAIDDRSDSRADALWDGQKLYVASHIFAKNSGAPAASGQRGELFRYSYNSVTKSYSLDTGFPVEITLGKSETLVIDKDSNGTLWATYVEDREVMVNHSLNGNDATWGVPFILPVGSSADVNSDDISSIITYSQHVGIMWSNQKGGQAMYFAVHADNAPDTVWTNVLAYGVSGDDHISLKSLEADSAGNVFAAIKTSNSSALIVALVCENNINRCKNASNWTAHTVYGSSSNSPTRPIMVIDESNRELMVFTRNSDGGQEGIYYKVADLDNIQFPTGLGTPFITLASDPQINDPTSTKQNVNATTGLAVLASDSSTKHYVHNYMPLTAGNEPLVTSFNPSSGLVGAEVTISGSRFISATQVTFGGTQVVSFIVDSDNQIRAIVPPGATTGKIGVTNSGGTGFSANDFTVIVAPSISSFAPTSGPVGTEVTVSGSGFSGATQVDFNGLAASSFAVDSDSQIRADVPNGATTGPISVVNPAGSDTSTDDFTVEYPVQHSLTVNTVGSGSVDATPPGGLYGEGVEVSLMATPDSGWQFVGWSGDLTGGANPSQLTMDADKVVTATFAVSVMFESVDYGESEASASATITVSLSGVADETVTVNYTTADGTANAPADYSASSGILSFSPGVTVQTFNVDINDDTTDELDETVSLTLSNANNAELTPPGDAATLTIVDDEAAPLVQFDQVSIDVDEDVGSVEVTVSLSHASAFPVSVDYASSDGSAKSPSDYDGVDSTLNFSSGVMSQSFTLTIVDDALDEASETFSLTLANPVNATLGTDSNAALSIADNDFPPSVQFGSAAFQQVEDGAMAVIAITLDVPSGKNVSVGYATSDGTAQAPVDYTATSGTVVVLAGETGTSFTVPIVADASDEPDRTVNLALSAPVNATLGSPDAAVLTILDDDDPPKVQFSETGPTVNESAGEATITATLTAPSAFTVTVEFSTSDGTADAGSDYLATGGLITFSPGDSAESFNVPIIDDVQDESNETVLLALGLPSNASLGSPAASTLIIIDNDGEPTVQFSSASYSVAEGDGIAVIQATLSAASGHSISVGYSTANGTAQDSGDYAGASGVLVFQPGVISQTFGISIVDDALDENDETLNLSLNGPAINASLGIPESAVLTIIDNDEPPTLQFEPGEYDTVEDAGLATLTVTLSAYSGLTVTVDVAVVGGTADGGIDYIPPVTSLTFAPGTNTQIFQIAVTDDSDVEPTESVILMLSNPQGATLLDAHDRATLTIADDDGTVMYIAILMR
jgi:hypothetical protein